MEYGGRQYFGTAELIIYRVQHADIENMLMYSKEILFYSAEGKNKVNFVEDCMLRILRCTVGGIMSCRSTASREHIVGSVKIWWS